MKLNSAGCGRNAGGGGGRGSSAATSWDQGPDG
jgi:hypothetical protein